MYVNRGFCNAKNNGHTHHVTCLDSHKAGFKAFVEEHLGEEVISVLMSLEEYEGMKQLEAKVQQLELELKAAKAAIGREKEQPLWKDQLRLTE